MAALKTLFQGDSLSIGFTFGTYDTSRIEHSYVYLNEVAFTTTLDAGVLRCAIPSSSTKQFCGNVPVLLVIDDSVFGVRKTAIGNIYFQSTGTFSDSSVNTGYNIEVAVTIEEDSTAVSVTVMEAFRGYSSYDIYVKYTTDVPILTESEWNDAYNDLVSYKEAAEDARDYLESEMFHYISDDATSVKVGLGTQVLISESTEGYPSIKIQFNI
jgi:hypothetical protein